MQITRVVTPLLSEASHVNIRITSASVHKNNAGTHNSRFKFYFESQLCFTGSMVSSYVQGLSPASQQRGH